MAFNDYGAMVWRDGICVNDTNADTQLFGDELNGMGGAAIYANLMEYGGKTTDMTQCYHAVLGDGPVRIGIYKDLTLVIMDELGNKLGFVNLWDSPFVEAFNVPDKYVIKQNSVSRRPCKELFTKEWIDTHRETRGHAKAMCNRFGGRRTWFGKKNIRWYNKHQKVRCRKPKKLSSIHAQRIPKGKVLLPDGMWFTTKVAGFEIHAGFDIALHTTTWTRYDENGKTVNTRSEDWRLLRIAVKLNGHWWTCRVGSCYGNGWQHDGGWPERMYEAVTYV